jgi:hypothetical protein
LVRRGPSCLAFKSFILLIVLFMLSTSASAQIHPSEPGVNLGDTSFLDALGGPGWLVEEMADGYHSDERADSSGRTTATPSINSFISLTHAAWTSNRKILHAWYGAEGLVISGYVHSGIQGSSGGLSTVIVSPLILQWGERKIGLIPVYQRVVFDFFLPVGEYQRSSIVNVSSHFFSANPYYAITALPAKHWETSWRIHYLWNAVNHSPPLPDEVCSTQAGQAVHFNATASRQFPHGVWIGANGYYLKQITDSQVNGAPIADSREQVGAIGPGAVWDLGQFMLFANAYHELGVVNRPKGEKLVLRISWLPGRKVFHGDAN